LPVEGEVFFLTFPFIDQAIALTTRLLVKPRCVNSKTPGAVSNYVLDDPLSTTQGRFNSRQKAPGPFHVRSIAVPKAGNQILFFGSRSDDEQTKQHDAGHKEEPVRRNQGNRHREQRSRVVERMPDPAIGAMYNQGVLLT